MRLNLPAILSVALLFLTLSVTAQFSYINPRPGSKMKNPETGIILRTGQAVNPRSLSNNLISITGSLSGSQAASIKLARDGKTILVTPERPFRGGETVTVTVNDGIRNADGSPVTGIRFDFETHPEWTPEEQAAITKARRQIKIDEYGEAAYESMFGTKQQDEQKLICNFLPPFTIQSTPGAYYDAPVFYRNQKIIDPICHIATIVSSDGDSIFAMYDNDRGIDFKINDNGYLTYYDISDSSFAMLDSGYALVKKFYMGNGYFADEHEFRVYPDGTSLMMCYDVQIVDLTPYGGPNNAEVTGLVIQQLDADDNVIFEWSGWDHVPLEYTNQSLTNGIVDYIHGNSLELDDDGNLLLSSRHLDEISKIDLSTGEFIWHMGGDANEFTFIDEIGTPKPFSYQHHFRRIGNGLYTLFDNGNNQQPERSVAKEYLIDQVQKTATLDWYYIHPQVNGKEVMGLAMGSVERLPNGNRLIDWGFRKFVTIADIPNFTEVDSAGNIVWEFWFDDSTYVSYRAFKNTWDRCNLILPEALFADSITPFSALLHWNDNSKISAFVLEYKKCSEATWMTIPLSGTSYQLESLDPNTCYEWRVLTVCDIYSDSFYTEVQQFNTLDPLGAPQPEHLPVLIQLLPNPASDAATLKFEISAASDFELAIMNLVGEVLMKNQLHAPAGFNKIKLDLADFAPGSYLVQIKTEDGTVRKKLVVN